MILNGRGDEGLVLKPTSRQTTAFTVFSPFDNNLLRVFVQVMLKLPVAK